MFKVAEVLIKSNEPIELEVPLRSQFVGLGIKNNIPVVFVLMPATQQLRERVKLVTAESGEEFGSMLIGDHPHYIGTFQHARRLPPPEGATEPVMDVRALHVFVFREKSHDTSNAPGNSIILS